MWKDEQRIHSFELKICLFFRRELYVVDAHPYIYNKRCKSLTGQFCKESGKLSLFSVKKSHKVSAVHDFFLPLHPLSGNPPAGVASPVEAVL